MGVNWPAFFFGIIWILASRLWNKAFLYTGAYLFIYFIEVAADAFANEELQEGLYLVLSLCYFSLWLVPAFQGNAWRVKNLQSRGYELVGQLQAETKDAAIAQASKAAET